MCATNSDHDLGHFYRRPGYILMNRVALKRLTRLTMDDYDLGHLDSWRAAVGASAA
jgi:hypothetical protein